MSKKLDSQLRGYLNPEGMKKDPTYPIFEAGVEWGLNKTRHRVLTYLEDRYIKDDNRPQRGSVEGNAILELARELSIFLQNLDVVTPEVEK